MEQVQKQQQGHSEPEQISQPHPVPAPQVNVNSEEVSDVLDEIDNVLEENAEEFVNGFVQKGGE